MPSRTTGAARRNRYASVDRHIHVDNSKDEDDNAVADESLVYGRDGAVAHDPEMGAVVEEEQAVAAGAEGRQGAAVGSADPPFPGAAAAESLPVVPSDPVQLQSSELTRRLQRFAKTRVP